MPKIGDKREWEPCDVCGEMQYEIYSSRASFGKGRWRGWILDYHFPAACIQRLKDRIAELSAREQR